MAIPRFSLHSSQFQDLAALRDLGSEKLGKVLSRLKELDHPPFSPDALGEIVNESLDDQRLASRLVDACLFLSSARREWDVSGKAILEGIRNSLEELGGDHGWKPEQIGEWGEVEGVLISILESEAVEGLTKVLDLSYDYGKLWRSARILTDIRPIYDQGGETIKVALVSFTLRLHFDDSDGRHSHSIAMDETDIKNLLAECQKALNKGESARRFAEEAANLPVTVTGRDRDA